MAPTRCRSYSPVKQNDAHRRELRCAGSSQGGTTYPAVVFDGLLGLVVGGEVTLDGGRGSPKAERVLWGSVGARRRIPSPPVRYLEGVCRRPLRYVGVPPGWAGRPHSNRHSAVRRPSPAQPGGRIVGGTIIATSSPFHICDGGLLVTHRSCMISDAQGGSRFQAWDYYELVNDVVEWILDRFEPLSTSQARTAAPARTG
jgi:hypothetical protein